MAQRKQKAKREKAAARIPNMGAAAQFRYDQFIEHYFATNQNGTAAAMLSGYSRKTAASIATDLLKHPYIAQKVEARRKERLEKIHASAEETLQIITRSARLDVRKLFDDKGRAKQPHELDDDTALALDGVDLDEVVISTGDKNGKGARVVRTIKYKGGKRMTAADMLAKHHGLYAKDKDVTDPDEGASQARERLALIEQSTSPKESGK